MVHDLQLGLGVLEDLSHLVFRTVQGPQEVQEDLAAQAALSFPLCRLDLGIQLVRFVQLDRVDREILAFRRLRKALRVPRVLYLQDFQQAQPNQLDPAVPCLQKDQGDLQDLEDLVDQVAPVSLLSRSSRMVPLDLTVRLVLAARLDPENRELLMVRQVQDRLMLLEHRLNQLCPVSQMNLVDRLVPMVQVARKVQEVQEVRRFPSDPQPMVQQDLSVRLARLGLCLPDHPLRLHFQTVQKDLVVQEVLNRQLDLLVRFVL